MKVYQDLVFRGPQSALDRLIPAIEQRLSKDWSRLTEAEKQVGRTALATMYCFHCTASGARPASELWIATRSDGTLYVSNIMGSDFTQLTYEQYNAILNEFYSRFAKAAADELGVLIELGNPDPKIEDYLSPETVKVLRSFSRIANRALLHPYDRRRWNEFLAAAHRERTSLDPDLLKRWLVDEEKWSEERAVELVTEYERARDLLSTFEAQHA